MDQSNNPNPMQPQQPASGMGDPNAIAGTPTTPISNPAPMTDPTMQPTVPQSAPAMPSAPISTQPTSPIDPTMPHPVDPTMQPTQPIAPQPIQETKSGGGGKKIMMLIIGLIVLLGLGAAAYFLVIKKPSSEPMTVETTPTPTPIPDQTLLEKEVGETPEEQEVIDIEEVSVDEEFQTIEQDLQKL